MLHVMGICYPHQTLSMLIHFEIYIFYCVVSTFFYTFLSRIGLRLAIGVHQHNSILPLPSEGVEINGQQPVCRPCSSEPTQEVARTSFRRQPAIQFSPEAAFAG